MEAHQTAFAVPSRLKPSEYESSFEAYVVRLHSPVPSQNLQHNISENERLVSIGMGTLLSVAGLAQGRWSGLGTFGLGAALIQRGVTGHCLGYHLLGVNTVHHDVLPSPQD